MKRSELIKDKEGSFTAIQRLKFIKTNAEKNHLFAFMCIKSGIHKLIRHSTENITNIEMFEDIVERKGDEITIEDTEPFFIKMLADVIESIIGAIMIDSCSIEETEIAWKYFFEGYLEKFADNPPIPPKRAFNKYCDEYDYLKDFKDSKVVTANLNKEELRNTYPDYKGNTSAMMYSFYYKDQLVFLRYYDHATKSKEKLFYKSIKKALERYLVPLCEKTLVPILEENDLLFRSHEVN